jgi:hypothetical protein
MKDKPETMCAALRILANDIHSPDDIPAMCLRDAANMIEELVRELDALWKAAEGLRKAKGRHHTQLAYERLMEVLG